MNNLLKNRVFKNASWIIICRIVQMAINLVVGMLTARYLGPNNYGIINYAGSVVAFVTPIMQLGINNILVQEIVNNPDDEGKILGTTIILNTFSSILCILGVFIFARIANANETETVLVCLLYSALLLFQAFEQIVYWFQAKLLSKYSSIVMFLSYLVVAIYRVFLLLSGKSVYWFAVSHAIDYLLIAIGCFIIYRKLGGQAFSFSKETAKRLVSKSYYYIISGMMVTIFAQTDKIMIKLMMGSEETGFYSAAIISAGLSNFIFVAIIDSMRTSIYEGKKRSNEIFANRLVKLYSIIIYFSLLQSMFMTLFSSMIIKILYGNQYYPSIAALRIVVWYTTFSYLGAVRDIWILAENQQKYLWKINLFGALANVVLNFVLIPKFGINGAAIASLLTQFFTNVILGYLIKPIRPNNKLMIKGLNPKVIFSIIVKR